MIPSQSQRRQNTSCDPCRRSKRRCFFSSFTDGATCANCKRLGHSCTFEFVASKSCSNKRRQQNPSPQWDGLDVADQAVEEFINFPSGEYPAASQEEMLSWLNMDAMENSDTCGPGNTESSDLHTPSRSNAEVIFGAQSESQLSPPLPGCPDGLQTPFLHETRYIVGSSPNSPIYLLNTKLDATILDKRLAHIHNTIVTGCASRFMDYDCNLYAKTPGYQLEHGHCEGLYKKSPVPLTLAPNTVSSEPTVSASQSNNSPSVLTQAFGQPEPGKRGMTPQVPSLNDAGCQMTVFGTIRFLDHFSDLYGNRLSPSARRQSDAVLKAVLRAFSMQWLSISESASTAQGDVTKQQATCDPLTNAFYDAWFEARSLIQKARHIRSFRIVYAILLFDGISIPTKTTESVVAHEFLDLGLEKLCHLDDLVKKYCATLGPQSIYSTHLEASLSVVRWGGYIRDIGASLLTNRQCKLPCAASHVTDDSNGISQLETSTALAEDQTAPSFYDSICDWFNNSNTHRDLGDDIPHICRKAVAEAFSVWGQIIEVKNLVSKPTRPSQLSDAICSAVTAVGKFDHLFRAFMTYCLDNLEHLPIPSKASSGQSYTYSHRMSLLTSLKPVSIEIFWDFAVLILAESVTATINSPYSIESHLVSSMHAYQMEAVSSIARTVDRMLSIPAEESFNLQNGLSAEVPIIAYHITPILTAATFEKAVENIISLHFAPLCSTDVRENEPLDSLTEHAWKQQVDIIMKGINSLAMTVGGSEAANIVSQSLLRRHGDILSECWSSDFST